MNILILGGNGQLGRRLVGALLAADHDVTCLARGTEPIPAGVNFIRADRDVPGSLEPVAGAYWDVIVDVATQPGRVHRAVAELQSRHWIYISSVSAYLRGDVLEQDEDADLYEPLSADTITDISEYGSAKVACENAVRSTSVNATIIRPGLIAGAGDDTGRSGYYPWRFAQGGEKCSRAR